MRRFIAAVLALVLGLVGYVALDVADLVPGVLTRDSRAAAAEPAPADRATPSPGTTTGPPAVVVPAPAPTGRPLEPAAASAPMPSRGALRTVVADALADPALGRSLGVTVRDAFTGESLLEVDPDTPRVPASTAKLLTALAVGVTLDPRASLPTVVVRGGAPGEVVLVAGGDTMLARGAGNPTAVEGRAGLGDLANQVAATLQGTGTGSVTLRLDTTHAAGPRYPTTWNMADVAAGYTQGVAMLGLAGQRPRPFRPSPRNPELEVAKAFAAALAKVGISARLAPQSTWRTPAPEGAGELGRVESAPVADILALALDDSDNALTEGLARQATVASGGAATFPAAVAFVRTTVAGLGVDLTGVTLRDTSGLSAGQAIPARVLADVLQLGTEGTAPSMQDTVAQLPVAGLDGTLHDRFLTAASHGAAGVARAKTGTLTGASGLAGTLVDRDGRLLSYVVLADRVPAGVGTLRARAALDRFVATLASCGCR